MTENEFLKYVDDLISWIDARRNQSLILSDLGADTAIKALNEYKQYRAIGTVEECREARERHIGKKPISRTNCKDGNHPLSQDIGICPSCNGIVAENMIWCDDCGQKLDWSE